MNQHSYHTRVYIEDTDAGGVVYHGNYLNYFQRARTEWLRAHGISIQDLSLKGLVFAICTVEIAYKRALVLDDEISVETEVVEAKKCSLGFLQKIYKVSEPNVVVCEAMIKVACVNRRLKPQSMPDEIKKIVEMN